MTRRALVAVLLVLGGVLAGCGRKGPPLPPLGRGPLPPAGVSPRQLGEEIHVAVAVAPGRLDGRPLPSPAVVELLFLPVERAEGPGSTWEGRGREREFLKRAKAVAELPLVAKRNGQVERVEAALPPARLEGINLERATLVFGARVRDARGRRSAVSPRTALSPDRPPAPPAGLEVAAAEGGIELRWSPPHGDAPRAYHVYRRVDDGPLPTKPLLVVPGTETRATDATAVYGKRYEYAVRAAAREGAPYVESVSAEAGPLDYRDVFPPPPPEEVGVIEVPEGLRVVWFPGRGSPAARFRVEREEPDGTFAGLATVEAPGSDWTDATAAPGRRYRYRVVAEDELGNASAPSPVAAGARVEREGTSR